MRSIEYEPRSLKDLLVEMKDTSELMVDLAYSAVLYRNQEIASEVLELEEHMNVLEYHARIALMLAARSTEDAEKLVGVAQVVGAAEKTSNAAEDIARIVLRDIGLPDELRSALPDAQEVIMRAEVDDMSELAGRTLEDINLETDTGVKIIAIKRDSDWIFAPGPDDQILQGDILLGEGPQGGVENVYEMATRTEFEHEGTVSSSIENLDRAVLALVEMKNTSELAVGLGYSAVLFESDEIAGEVKVLESRTDNLKDELETWVLESASHVEEPRKLRGLIHLAISSEVITDAALEMADAVMRDIELHPVVSEAIRESDEIITRVKVAEDAEIKGLTLGEIALETETGMRVMAIRREDGWVYNPNAETKIESKDMLIVRGTRTGEERLREMAGKRVGED